MTPIACSNLASKQSDEKWQNIIDIFLFVSIKYRYEYMDVCKYETQDNEGTWLPTADVYYFYLKSQTFKIFLEIICHCAVFTLKDWNQKRGRVSY